MPTLSDICLAIVDCEHKTAPKADEGWPLIRTTDIGRGRLDLSTVQRVDASAYEEWTRRAIPQPGDLILAREAPVGNVAIVTPGLEPALGQRTVLIRPDPDKVDPDFLTYRLLGQDVQYRMQGVANGATVPHLNVADIRNLSLPEMPPLRVQRTIGSALAAFDDLIDNNRRRVEVIEETARLIYREWFVHFRFPGHEEVELADSDLGPIPDGWLVTALAEHVGLERESVKPAEHPEETFDHYSIPAFDAHRLPAAEPGSDIKSSKYLIAGKRVLLSKLNPRFPRVWRVDASRSERRSICSTEFLVLVTDQDWPASFVYAMVGDSEFGGRLAAMAGGTSTSHQRVKPGDVISLPIAGPEASLVSRYHELAGPMLRLADNLTRQSEVLRETRDLLLPRLVSGELDVSGLDLELAEVG
jgi:type I restriction enzyme, S subunit